MKKPLFFSKIGDSIIGYARQAFSKADKKALAIAPIQANISAMRADPVKGSPKPTKVSFLQLRGIARVDSLTRICVNVIKKEVSQSSWHILPKPGVESDPEKIKTINQLFTMLNSNDESLRVLLDRVLEDILVLDAGVIEKVFNAKGELVELNSVDGATIRPRYNEYGDLDPNNAYVQVINGKVVAKFKKEEIIYMMANPQNELMLYGYGMSPIESILMTVQASLNAQVYNAKTFSVDNVPPGILDLGSMSTEEAQQFVALWNATVIGSNQRMKFIWGSDNPKKYVPFQNGSHKDMQYVEYLDWLSRIKLAAYGLSGIDANITQDVNRATAEVQETISTSRGVQSTKQLVEEYFNREILIPQGFGDYEFKFEKASNLKDKRIQAEIDRIYLQEGVVSPDEISKREGYSVVEFDDFMDDAGSSGNSPNPEDMAEVKDIEDIEGVKPVRTNKKYYPPLYE
jgi:hypothetical protein